MISSARTLALAGALAAVSFAQSAPAPNPAPANAAEATRASAYYNFAMGRLYALMAQAEGSQEDAVKAIQFYKDALKADPKASDAYEELTDLYLALNRPADATAMAQEVLKQDPDNVNAHRMLGRVYFSQINRGSQGQIDERALRSAMTEFQKVTTKDPKDADSWVRLGRLYAATNDNTNAEKAYNSALAVEPDNDEALTGLAMVYDNSGDTAKAIEKLKAATEKNPNPSTLRMLAQAYEEQKDYKSAADVLRKAADMDPEDQRLTAALAEDLVQSEQYDDALKVYGEMAARAPNDAQILVRMAGIYGAKKDYAKAHEVLDKAKKADPNGTEPREAEVQLYAAEGKYDQAIAGLKSILDDTARKIYPKEEQQSRSKMYERLGALNVTAKHFPEAIEAFRQMSVYKDSGPQMEVRIVEVYRTYMKDLASAQREADAALKQYPSEYGVVQEHAEVLGDLGKIDEAVKELRGLLNGPHDCETLLNIAEADEKGKRFDDAGKAVNDAEKVAASDEEKQEVYFMRGALLERQKKFDASEEAFRKVLALNPDHSHALNYLGYMLADRNVRLDEAYKMVRKAVDLEPDNGAYLDSLGWVLFRQGKLEDAERTLVRAVDLTDQDPTVHDHLGDVYMRLGKTQEAIAQWNASMKGFKEQPASATDSEEVSKVNGKLDAARVKLAQEKKR